MTFKKKIEGIIEIVFTNDNPYSHLPPPPVRRPGPRALTEADIVAFEKAARKRHRYTRPQPPPQPVMEPRPVYRDNPCFEMLEELITLVQHKNRMKAFYVRQDIKWLRRQLYKQGHPLGRK